jgi:hypothetical protein
MLDDTGHTQNAQMPRHVRLRKAERLFEMAHTQLSMSQQRDDSEPGLVSQRLEESGKRSDVERQHMEIRIS